MTLLTLANAPHSVKRPQQQWDNNDHEANYSFQPSILRKIGQDSDAKDEDGDGDPWPHSQLQVYRDGVEAPILAPMLP